MLWSMKFGTADLHKGYLSPQTQQAIVAALSEVVAKAPFFHPVTPWGKRMRVRMTSCGRYGWFTDRRGYRYVDRHPEGQPWPPIPDCVLAVWENLVGDARWPDCCLINHYDSKARMGLHQDKDEADFSWPVVSVSLGDTGIFRIGGQKRDDPTKSMPLESGDVVVLGGPARLAFHGVDRIRAGSSQVSPWGGRINLTLRVVD